MEDLPSSLFPSSPQRKGSKSMMRMIRFFFRLSILRFAAAQLPSFRFSNDTGDIFTGPGDELMSANVNLLKPVSYDGSNVTIVQPCISRYTALYDSFHNLSASAGVYPLDLNTIRGRINQNQVWLRASHSTEDLILEQTNISGNETLLNPPAVTVSTWYKVEVIARPGPQRTCQLVMANSTNVERTVSYQGSNPS